MAVWARPPRRRPVQMDVHVHIAWGAGPDGHVCACGPGWLLMEVRVRMAPPAWLQVQMEAMGTPGPDGRACHGLTVQMDACPRVWPGGGTWSR